MVAHAPLAPLEPLPGKLCLSTRFSISDTGQTRGHSSRVCREVILRRVPHVAQCHHGRRVPKQPLDSDDRNACLRAVYAEGMSEVVDADVVQAGFAAGALEDALGQLIGAERVRKHPVRRSAAVPRPMFCQHAGQRHGDGYHARARRCFEPAPSVMHRDQLLGQANVAPAQPLRFTDSQSRVGQGPLLTVPAHGRQRSEPRRYVRSGWGGGLPLSARAARMGSLDRYRCARAPARAPISVH